MGSVHLLQLPSTLGVNRRGGENVNTLEKCPPSTPNGVAHLHPRNTRSGFVARQCRSNTNYVMVFRGRCSPTADRRSVAAWTVRPAGCGAGQRTVRCGAVVMGGQRRCCWWWWSGVDSKHAQAAGTSRRRAGGGSKRRQRAEESRPSEEEDELAGGSDGDRPFVGLWSAGVHCTVLDFVRPERSRRHSVRHDFFNQRVNCQEVKNCAPKSAHQQRCSPTPRRCLPRHQTASALGTPPPSPKHILLATSCLFLPLPATRQWNLPAPHVVWTGAQLQAR